MLSYNLLIIICIACIISIYTYSFYRKDAIVSGTADSASRLHLLSSRLEVACDELINIVQNCAGRKSLFHTSVLDRQSQRSGESSGIYAAEVLRDLCAISGYNRYIHKITVYERDSLFIQAGTSYGSWDDADSIMAAPWFNELLTKNMQEYTLTLKENPFPLDAKTVPYILPLIRPLQYSKKDTPQDAWVCLLLSPRLFQDTLELLSQDRSVLIMTGGLSPIESTNMGHFSMEEIKAALEAHPSPTGSMRTALSGMDCILTWERLAVSGLLLCEVLPVKDISPDPNAILFTVGLVFLSCIAIGLSLSLLFTRYLTRPIMRLTQHMEVISSGDFSRAPEIESDDELGIIGRQINEMSAHVSALMENRIRSEQEKMDLEIKMLQAQINPHFLYNTLDSLYCMAIIHGDDQIADMTLALSDHFKLSLNKGKRFCTVADTVAQVKDYMKLQGMRFGERFKLSVEVAEDILKEEMLTFLLQPFVENAIYHGLEPKLGGGTIRLRGWKEEEKLYFTVADDGIGVDDITKLDSGFGINNVKERIKLHYGEDYGFMVKSGKGQGTEITIVLPLGKREQHRNGESYVPAGSD